jgi:16S rRNA (cytosine1402-N4)-methyltransferase
MYHNPVMLAECIEGLNIKPDGTYVDVTFGGGGHSKAILEKLITGKLYAFDQDNDAQANIIDDPRFVLVKQNFKYLKKYLKLYGALPIDGLIGDLGISSHQIDKPERGFSTRFEADLDMRMDTTSKLTAKEIVNHYNEAQLQSIFSEYGEIINSKKLADTIVSTRKTGKINTVNDLKKAMNLCINKVNENQYYAQVFQALRIEVNSELDVLKDMLLQCGEVIGKDGRLVIMSYHSLEDRLVKNYINKGKFEGEIEKNEFGHPVIESPFKALTKKPIEATASEVKENSRARSAKLRIAVKVKELNTKA